MTWIKKTFYISLLVFVIALLFWGVYNLSFKKASPQQETARVPAGNQQPIAPKNNTDDPIAAVSDEGVIAPTLVPAGNAIKYYSASTGKVFQIDTNGNNKKAIAEKELIGIIDAFWSPDKTKVITKFKAADGNFRFYFYDYAADRATPLKDNIDQIAWNGSSNKIFYKYFDAKTKKRTLSISEPDGTGWSDLADIDFRDMFISQVPRSGLVSFWNKPDSYTATNLDVIALAGGDVKTILKDLYGADYLWNNEGTDALVSYVTAKGGNKLQLATVNSSGGEFINLNIPTFASKCVWSKNDKVVYYALPGSIPENGVMPNDYNSGKFQTTDTFWKIDLTTGEKTRIVSLDKMEGAYDATEMFLNNDESILFFVNKTDGKLYRVLL
ncbi:MAG: hypothetical protein HGB08_04125 [Candidatus Moranbacteria bacterium]|nr:hypothetical protein [Candidatus Moranbacteria bacterium]